MRPLRFASIALIPSIVFAAPLVFGQNPPAAPAPAPPPAAPPTSTPTPGVVSLPADAGKSAALKRLEERLHALSTGRGLTADEVARRTLTASPTLEAQKWNVEASAAGVNQAKAGYYPQLTVSASYTRLSDIDAPTLGAAPGGAVATNAAPGPIDLTDPAVQLFSLPSSSGLSFPVVLDNYALAARLNVPISDYFLRVGPAVAGATRANEAARYEAAAARSTVERDARVAYYRWVRSQAQELIAAQSLELAKGHLSDANNSFQAGLASKADVLRTETEVKGAELFYERAKHATELAGVSLGVLMRDAPGAQYEVGEDVFAPLAELERLPATGAAYAEAVAQRPELKALQKAEAALREQATVARAGNYPRLDAQANGIYANPNPRYFPQEEKFRGTWDAGVVLSFTPTDIPGAQAESSVAEARALEVAAQRRGFYENLRLDVNQVLRLADEARFEIGVSRDAAVSADEGYRVRRELYRAGRATTVEVTDAETVLTRARIALVDAHIAARIALVELRHTLGRDTTPNRATLPR